MQLIGPFYSPYVRRVAISMKLMQLPFVHVDWSPSKDDKIMHALNPLLKVPALILEDQTLLTDSTLILQYLEQLPQKKISLMPIKQIDLAKALHLIGVALVASEKAVQVILENSLHEETQRSVNLLKRSEAQVVDALRLIEQELAQVSKGQYVLGNISQADVTLATVYNFIGKKFPELCQQAQIEHLANHCTWLEQQQPFASITQEHIAQPA